MKTTDHLGFKYDTVREMCDAYDVKVKTYLSRLHDGKTQREALTGVWDGKYKRTGGKSYGNKRPSGQRI